MRWADGWTQDGTLIGTDHNYKIGDIIPKHFPLNPAPGYSTFVAYYAELDGFFYRGPGGFLKFELKINNVSHTLHIWFKKEAIGNCVKARWILDIDDHINEIDPNYYHHYKGATPSVAIKEGSEQDWENARAFVGTEQGIGSTYVYPMASEDDARKFSKFGITWIAYDMSGNELTRGGPNIFAYATIEASVNQFLHNNGNFQTDMKYDIWMRKLPQYAIGIVNSFHDWRIIDTIDIDVDMIVRDYEKKKIWDSCGPNNTCNDSAD